MTVREYISDKFQSFGIKLSEADLLDVSINANSGLDEYVSEECIGSLSVAIAHLIPSLLLHAASISESGFSMSWDKNGIKDYYSLLCKRYGLEDELNTNKPKIRFL